MKTSKLIFAIAILGLVFTSCVQDDKTTVVVDFEDVKLDTTGYWNGSDKAGTLINGSYSGSFQSSSANLQFLNTFIPSTWGDYWAGLACSSKNDTLTAGYNNQYSVIAGSGALKSAKFGLAYDTATINIPNTTATTEIKSIMLTNSTYAYFEMKNGGFGKKFTTGDWFKVIIKGYFDATETGAVEFYLADFRDGKSKLLKIWEKVDLSSLGKVNKIQFTFDSSDKGMFGVNTPKYVCLDNIELEQTISNK